MKIDARFTILFEEGLRVEVQDDASGLTFLELKADPVTAAQALGRLNRVPAECKVYHFERVGKTLTNEKNTGEKS